MKLRAEFIEDTTLRERFIADLSEMESMIATTLTLGRTSSRLDPFISTNLKQLCDTVIDDVIASRPEDMGKVTFLGDVPAVLINAKPLLLKRALTNVISNALIYGGNADVRL